MYIERIKAFISQHNNNTHTLDSRSKMRNVIKLATRKDIPKLMKIASNRPEKSLLTLSALEKKIGNKTFDYLQNSAAEMIQNNTILYSMYSNSN